MSSLVLAEDDNVIQIHQHKLADDFLQQIIHDVLEYARWLLRPKQSTLNSNKPIGIVYAALGTSSGCSLTW